MYIIYYMEFVTITNNRWLPAAIKISNLYTWPNQNCFISLIIGFIHDFAKKKTSIKK